MSKTDTAIKRILDNIGDIGFLRRRRFLGSSRQDQKLWVDNGLSFGFNGVVYGSCDFAWFSDEEWLDPFSNRTSNERPYLTVEGTDCLNTRSWGNAQLQRFHHAMGPFLCGIDSIYFLKQGKHPIRHYLSAAAFYATKTQRALGNKASYLVTDDITDIREIVERIGTFGSDSKEAKEKISEVLEKMYFYFQSTFEEKPYNSNWIKYLQSRAIIKTPQNAWVKDLGPKKENFTDSSIRMGHIVVGEALSSLYLLLGSGKFDYKNDMFYYLFPLMDRVDVEELDRTLTRDKEWLLLRKAGYPWKIVTLDELEGVGDSLKSQIKSYKNQNRNHCKKGWKEAKATIRTKLINGEITIGDVPEQPTSIKQLDLTDF